MRDRRHHGGRRDHICNAMAACHRSAAREKKRAAKEEMDVSALCGLPSVLDDDAST